MLHSFFFFSTGVFKCCHCKFNLNVGSDGKHNISLTMLQIFWKLIFSIVIFYVNSGMAPESAALVSFIYKKKSAECTTSHLRWDTSGPFALKLMIWWKTGKTWCSGRGGLYSVFNEWWLNKNKRFYIKRYLDNVTEQPKSEILPEAELKANKQNSKQTLICWSVSPGYCTCRCTYSSYQPER